MEGQRGREIGADHKEGILMIECGATARWRGSEGTGKKVEENVFFFMADLELCGAQQHNYGVAVIHD